MNDVLSPAGRAELAKDAFIWGMPLVIMARSLRVSEKAGLPINQLFMTREIAMPQFRQVGPNIDTLIGHAWLDLGAEPQVFGVPEADGRYYSVQLQDMYMNSFEYFGRRTTGTGPGAFAITGPGFSGALPDGVTEIKATTSKVLAYIRTMVRDQDDLAAALAVHGAYTLGPLSAYPDGRGTPIAKSDRARLFPHVDFYKASEGFFEELNALVKLYPPLAWDAPNLARFAPIGVGAPAPAGGSPLSAAEQEAAITAGYTEVRQSLKLTWTHGWARRDNVPAFIRDPVQRAANNLFGKGTHRSDEAVYWATYQGGMGDWLSGANKYRLRFAPGRTPPANAFWSLTLYGSDYVLFDNPLGRYGILDRTQGLKYNADGGLEIQIQADEPEEGISNWLPTPRGDFQLHVRSYEPGESVVNGTYLLPPLEIVGKG